MELLDGPFWLRADLIVPLASYHPKLVSSAGVVGVIMTDEAKRHRVATRLMG